MRKIGTLENWTIGNWKIVKLCLQSAPCTLMLWLHIWELAIISFSHHPMFPKMMIIGGERVEARETIGIGTREYHINTRGSSVPSVPNGYLYFRTE